MEKHLLIAIDDSRQTFETINYAAQIGNTVSPVKFTLLHIQPSLSQYLTDEAKRKSSARQELEKIVVQNDTKARALLETASERLVGAGIAATQIEHLTLPRNKGVADDILALATAKSFDAILAGRRGASYLQQWLTGSVTANLVEHSQVIPIWVVDGNVPNNNVLLAADGSQSTLRALDHLAFMLADQTEQAIKMLHIRPRIQDFCEIALDKELAHNAETVLLDEDQHCMDDFYGMAQTVLQKNNVDESRLEIVTLDGKLSVTRSILSHARDNSYGTIVLGRRGRSNSKFFGSVSRGILQKTEDMALWVVP